MFHFNLTRPLHATFGGLFAVQVALFLGYTVVYLIGIDGGVQNFSGTTRGDNISADYHKRCFWHLYDWWRNQDRVKIYQTNPKAVINWFPYRTPPLEG